MSGGLPVNVNFSSFGTKTNSTILASGNTEIIRASANPIWRNYGLLFRTLPGQTSVVLKMISNGSGAITGNDFAIDDIAIRPCMHQVEIINMAGDTSMYLCEDDVPIDTVLEATSAGQISYLYQWQQSSDGINWFRYHGRDK